MRASEVWMTLAVVCFMQVSLVAPRPHVFYYPPTTFNQQPDHYSGFYPLETPAHYAQNLVYVSPEEFANREAEMHPPVFESSEGPQHILRGPMRFFIFVTRFPPVVEGVVQRVQNYFSTYTVLPQEPLLPEEQDLVGLDEEMVVPQIAEESAPPVFPQVINTEGEVQTSPTEVVDSNKGDVIPENAVEEGVTMEIPNGFGTVEELATSSPITQGVALEAGSISTTEKEPMQFSQDKNNGTLLILSESIDSVGEQDNNDTPSNVPQVSSADHDAISGGNSQTIENQTGDIPLELLLESFATSNTAVQAEPVSNGSVDTSSNLSMQGTTNSPMKDETQPGVEDNVSLYILNDPLEVTSKSPEEATSIVTEIATHKVTKVDDVKAETPTTQQSEADEEKLTSLAPQPGPTESSTEKDISSSPADDAATSSQVNDIVDKITKLSRKFLENEEENSNESEIMVAMENSRSINGS